MSKVVLLGAGPGELDLLTLKGQQILKEAQCVIYDRLLNPAMLALTPITCEKIFVGKANHKHTMPQDKINELLVEKAREYDLVVRLKGGDPYVFGRGGEEALFLKEHGIDVEIVPGVSSSIAALASAGIPITHRGLAKGFQVIIAHSKKDERADIDYSSLLDETVTLVFLMGLAHVGEIARGLMEAGRCADTNAAVISNGTTNHQVKVIGTLLDIEDKVKNSPIVSPAIIVVGDVVQLSNELDFFEKRPLFGKKYFLPIIRSLNYSYEKGIDLVDRNELEEKLVELGADVITVETGTIAAIKCNLEAIVKDSIDGFIVFTSSNGVKSFFWNLHEARQDLRCLSNYKFAVIGKKTESTLSSFGIIADIVSTVQNGGDLAEELNKEIKSGMNIYWFTTKDSSEDFAGRLDKSCNLIKIECYENIPAEIVIDSEVCDNIAKCDGAIFTSGSNAASTLPLIKDAMPENIYSIGPACSRRIKGLCNTKIIEARISSYSGILELLS